MWIKVVLMVIAMVLQEIANGMGEEDAIKKTAEHFDMSSSEVRKFFEEFR